jgi:ActR/RegA family two-component response regulator
VACALIIDSVRADGESMKRDLERWSVQAFIAPPRTKISDLLVPFVPDLIVVDPQPGSLSGLIKAVRDRFPRARIVVTASSPSYAECVWALKLGADDYHPKPIPAADIVLAGSNPSNQAAPGRLLSVAEVEREYLSRVVAMCGGNRSEAARRLGMHRYVLQRKLAKTSFRVERAGGASG